MNDIRNEQLSLALGMMFGQISELLNNIKNNDSMTKEMIYASLLDITQAGSLHVHDLFYKGNKP